MPFEHALVSLDDGRRLSAAENPPYTEPAVGDTLNRILSARFGTPSDAGVVGLVRGQDARGPIRRRHSNR
jgi:hypothetical protein